jgi:multidrug resistance efflux pump
MKTIFNKKFLRTYKSFGAQWQMWQQKYLIKSPVTGKAVFFNVWKENQYVNANDPILMVVPPVQQYVVKASLPIDGAGKVKADQKVLIKLSAYPYNEFGMLQGKVKHISTVALDTSFALEMTYKRAW